MDSTLVALQESLGRFVEKEVRPRAQVPDDECALPPDWIKSLSELGCFGIGQAEPDGIGLAGECVVVRELARASGSLAVSSVNRLLLVRALDMWPGSHEALADRLGSGAGAVAVARIASAADASIHLAVGMSPADAILVLLSGGEIRPTAKILSHPGVNNQNEVGYDGLRGLRGFEIDVGAGAALDAEQGRRLVAADRILLASVAGGLARGALECAVAYAKDRVQFGRPIAAYGEIQALLAKAWTRTASAEASAMNAAREFDQGSHDVAAATIAFLHASHAAVRAAERAQHVHGGYGQMREYPVGRYVRDARTLRSLAGPLTALDHSLAAELGLLAAV